MPIVHSRHKRTNQIMNLMNQGEWNGMEGMEWNGMDGMEWNGMEWKRR